MNFFKKILSQSKQMNKLKEFAIKYDFFKLSSLLDLFELSNKSSVLAVFPMLSRLIIINANSDISLTDDKDSCYFGLNNQKGKGWVLNSKDSNLYDITIKSYYFINLGSSTYQVSWNGNIRISSWKLIKVKYPYVFFSADSVIEIDPGVGVLKTSKQHYETSSKFPVDIIAVPIYHITSVWLSVYNEEFENEQPLFAKLTSALSEHKSFAYWTIRQMCRLGKS